MKLHFLFSSALLILGAAPLLHADPILPYQEPIFQQITNDLAGGAGDARTLNKAVETYERNSKSLNADIGILRDLNSLLASTPNYPDLLSNAAAAYLVDFNVRSAALHEQLRPAPRGAPKDSARTLLRKIDKALVAAEDAANTSDRIKSLGKAASKFQSASNTVQRALRASIGLSSMVARIGVLDFTSSKGFTTGGTNFMGNMGTTIGEFKGLPQEGQGILTVSAIDNGNVVRGINLHVEGISTNTPAIYPLGVGENSAFYDATIIGSRKEYHFQGSLALTNATVPGAFLAIDYIGTNYLLGRFAFVGTNHVPESASDTNTLVTVSEGEFQLNFYH